MIKDYFNNTLDTPSITKIFVEDHELIIDYATINAQANSEYEKEIKILVHV